MKTLISPLVLIASTAFLAACASSGYKMADKMAVSLQETAQGIDETLVPFDAALIALNDLVDSPGTDMAPQFQSYSSAVNQLDAKAQVASGQADAMQLEGLAYFQKWNEERADIHNVPLRMRSFDRKIAVGTQFEDVRSNYSKSKADFDTFISDLKDIRTALGTDLTPGGLDSIRNPVNKANSTGRPLRESLVRLSEQFRNFGADLSSGSPTS
jgi:hypothetical protein